MRTSSEIPCPVCHVPAGTDCAGEYNHVGRGLAIAVGRSPYQPVLARGVPERALRKEHNHIFQVRPRRVRYVAADCPACSTIDLGKMDEGYAELSYMRDQRIAEYERALRQ